MSLNTALYNRQIAEKLYGRHLKSEVIFEKHIGDISDPVIVTCNGFSDQISHAFLMFWNEKRGEHNTFHIRQGPYFPEFMNKEETINYFEKENKHIVGAVSLNKLAQLYGDTPGPDNMTLLRDFFKARMQIEGVPYCIQNQNCMTFSMLAFAATNFDLEGFLNRVGLNTLQSPYHIIQALAQSEKNRPALHTPEHPNPGLVPQWLMEINQPQGSSEAGAVALVPR